MRNWKYIGPLIISIAVALAILIGMGVIFKVSPQCDGKYRFEIGGDKFLLFSCEPAKAVEKPHAKTGLSKTGVTTPSKETINCVNSHEIKTEVLHTSTHGCNGGVGGCSSDSSIRGPRSCGGNGWSRSHYDVKKLTKNGDCSVEWVSTDANDCRYQIHAGIGGLSGGVDCQANVYRKRIKPGQPPLCK